MSTPELALKCRVPPAPRVAVLDDHAHETKLALPLMEAPAWKGVCADTLVGGSFPVVVQGAMELGGTAWLLV